MARVRSYLFYFYVPITHKEVVKAAVFAAGAGEFGNYDSCAFETVGVGQFRAKSGASPYLGSVGKVEFVDEVKIEIMVHEPIIDACLAALRVAHPYEEVAFGFLPIYPV